MSRKLHGTYIQDATITLTQLASNVTDKSNASYDQANTARDTANSAYGAANLKLNIAGGTISGDLTVSGNLYLSNNATMINVSSMNITDPLIYLASNNDTSDAIDIGFVGGANTSGTYGHTGLVRHAADAFYYLFDKYVPEPTNNVIDVSVAKLATLRANINANSLIVQGNANITGYTTTTLKSTKEFLVWNTNTSTANTIDVSNSNWFRHTLTGNTTLTFANTTSNGTSQLITVILIQDATGGRGVTWANTIYWAGGLIPPATTNANARDVWTFVTIDGGSTFLGTLTIKDAR